MKTFISTKSHMKHAICQLFSVEILMFSKMYLADLEKTFSLRSENKSMMHTLS